MCAFAHMPNRPPYLNFESPFELLTIVKNARGANFINSCCSQTRNIIYNQVEKMVINVTSNQNLSPELGFQTGLLRCT
jgi:hypothetical protein